MELFNSFHSMVPSADLEFSAIAEYIKSEPALKSATNWYREILAINNPNEADKRKKNTPQIAVAFRMDGGKSLDNCRQCLYYTFIDFDDKDAKTHLPKSEFEKVINILSKNHHTILGYKSISGRGYHAIVPYELPEGIDIDMVGDKEFATELYKRVHRYVNRYFSSLTGHRMDELCGNPNRMVGLAHDPDVVYRPDAQAFRLTRHDLCIDDNDRLVEKKKAKTNSKKIVHIDDHLQRAIKMLQDDGMEFVQGQRHDFLVRLSFTLNRMGVNQEEAEEAIDQEFGKDYNEERPSKVLRSCYQHARDEFGTWSRPRDEQKLTKMEKINHFLKDKHLRYDTISRKIQGHSPEWDDDFPETCKWVELHDRDINDLLYLCNKETRENISSQTFRNVLNSSVVQAVNPLREYLKTLPEWDDSQEDFIDRVAQTVHTKKQDLWRQCFKKWFVAMVASWIKEDIVNHQVLVLLGEQGIYKTTWLDRLLPPELAQYSSKQSVMEHLDKDEQLRATEYAIINFDEIDKLTERGLSGVKSIITTSHIDVRAPYGFSKEKRVRIASYVASGNKLQFLTDPTGNRRWLPFIVDNIDSPYKTKLPYQGMYAQALRLIKDGFYYWFEPEDSHGMSTYVDNFMVETTEEQLIPIYFRPAAKGSEGAIFLTGAEISAKLIAFGNIRNPLSPQKLGILMKKFGFIPVHTNSRRGYIVRELTADELKANRSRMAKEAEEVTE